MTQPSCGRGLAALAAVLLGLAGCGKKDAPEPAAAPAEPAAAPAAVAQEKPAPPAAAAPRDRLHAAFADAVRTGDNPPADAVKPPDLTATSKLAYRVLEDVAQSWDAVRFTTPAGKHLAYTAVLETSEGEVHIAFFPELAPNHVRNFVCLARAGYYDGLCFDRCRREAVNDSVFQALEGGCPLGTGETITGSVGYWLKDELVPADKMSHDAGTVGACRMGEADTAATRFYISLDKAPFLDGNFTTFGKVVQGLDVARRIYAQPVVAEDKDRDGARRPQKPVVIRKVTIHTREVEAASK